MNGASYQRILARTIEQERKVARFLNTQIQTEIQKKIEKSTSFEKTIKEVWTLLLQYESSFGNILTENDNFRSQKNFVQKQLLELKTTKEKGEKLTINVKLLKKENEELNDRLNQTQELVKGLEEKITEQTTVLGEHGTNLAIKSPRKKLNEEEYFIISKCSVQEKIKIDFESDNDSSDSSFYVKDPVDASNPFVESSSDFISKYSSHIYLCSMREESEEIIETDEIHLNFGYVDKKKKRFINQYFLESEIGNGSFGSVWKTINIFTKKIQAVKIFNKTMLKRQRIFKSHRKITNEYGSAEKEIELMKQIYHPNIVNMVEIIDDPKPKNHFMYLIMEHAVGGALRIIDENTWECTPVRNLDTLLSYTKDIIAGLDYLHSKNIFHSDIKLENMLLDSNGRIKIADFGRSDIIIDEFITSCRGTLIFQSPETGDLRFRWRPVDLWAVGVSLYCLLYGRLPFDFQNGCIFDIIETQEITFKESTNNACANCISRLLDKNPDSRLSMKEFQEHEWINSKFISYKNETEI